MEGMMQDQNTKHKVDINEMLPTNSLDFSLMKHLIVDSSISSYNIVFTMLLISPFIFSVT